MDAIYTKFPKTGLSPVFFISVFFLLLHQVKLHILSSINLEKYDSDLLDRAMTAKGEWS